MKIREILSTSVFTLFVLLTGFLFSGGCGSSSGSSDGYGSSGKSTGKMAITLPFPDKKSPSSVKISGDINGKHKSLLFREIPADTSYFVIYVYEYKTTDSVIQPVRIDRPSNSNIVTVTIEGIPTGMKTVRVIASNSKNEAVADGSFDVNVLPGDNNSDATVTLSPVPSPLPTPSPMPTPIPSPSPEISPSPAPPSPSPSPSPSPVGWKVPTQLNTGANGMISFSRGYTTFSASVIKCAPLGGGKMAAIYMQFYAASQQYIWGKIWNGTAWEPSERLDDNISGWTAGTADIAVDSTGKAMTVWSESDGTTLHIYYAKFNPVSSVWNKPASSSDKLISDAASCSAFGARLNGTSPTIQDQAIGDPSIAFDKYNNAVVVWASARTTTNKRIWASSYDGTSFKVPNKLQNPAATYDVSSRPKVAFLNNSATGYAVWIEKEVTASQNQISVGKFIGGSGSMSYSSANISRLDSGNNSGDNSCNPQLVLSETKGICVFEKHDSASGKNNVFAATLSDPLTWNASNCSVGGGINGTMALGPYGVNYQGLVNPQGCMLPNDEPMVVFGRENNPTNPPNIPVSSPIGQMYASKGSWSGNNIIWGNPVVISGDFSTSSWLGQIASSGNLAICIFAQGKDASANMVRYYYAQFNGTLWAKPLTNTTPYAIDPGLGVAETDLLSNLTMDVTGKAYAVFMALKDGLHTGFANLYY